MNKVAVFIDNSNTFKNIKRIKNVDSDWVCFYDPFELSRRLVGKRELVYVGFYCVHPPTYLLKEDGEHVKKYILTERYYAEIEKMSLVEVKYGNLKGSGSNLKEKNLDTQLTADVVTMAAFNKYDTAIIVASDGDYVSAIKGAKQFDKKIENVFFRGFVSCNLKGLCDLSRCARRSYFQPLKFNKTVKPSGE